MLGGHYIAVVGGEVADEIIDRDVSVPSPGPSDR